MFAFNKACDWVTGHTMVDSEQNILEQQIQEIEVGHAWGTEGA